MNIEEIEKSVNLYDEYPVIKKVTVLKLIAIVKAADDHWRQCCGCCVTDFSSDLGETLDALEAYKD